MGHRPIWQPALALLCASLLAGCTISWWVIPLAPGEGPFPVPGSPRPGPTLPPLPQLEGSEVLEGAPAVAVWAPEGNDRIRISEWRSGQPLRRLLVVPRLYADRTTLGLVRVSMAPGGRFVTVSEDDSLVYPSHDHIRVFASDRGLVWTSPDDLWPGLTTRWSPDGTRFAIDDRGRWIVLDLSDPAAVTTTSIDTSRPRSPSGIWRHPWLMVDFSEDGRTLYGADETGVRPAFRVAVRASADGGRVEPIDRLPTSPGRRLTFPPELGNPRIEPTIDPATGRILDTMFEPADSYTMSVWSDGIVRRFALEASWADLVWYQGSILGLWREGPLPGRAVHLSEFEVEPTLGSERRILSLPATISIGLVALTRDYVALRVGPPYYDMPSELLVVRAADGARTVIADPTARIPGALFFAGWMTNDPDWTRGDPSNETIPT